MKKMIALAVGVVTAMSAGAGSASATFEPCDSTPATVHKIIVNDDYNTVKVRASDEWSFEDCIPGELTQSDTWFSSGIWRVKVGATYDGTTRKGREYLAPERARLIRGSERNGTWKLKLDFTDRHAKGRWNVHVDVFDEWGNWTQMWYTAKVHH